MGIIPISASTILTLSEVAEHWSQETCPKREVHDLINEMLKHWWAGNLKLDGPSRLEIMELLLEHSGEGLLFLVQAQIPPITCVEYDDGSADVDVGHQVPIPSFDPNTWGEANCTEAFRALSELRDYQAYGEDMVFGIHAALMVSEPAFRSWLVQNHVNVPKFWKSSRISTRCSWSPDEMERWWLEEGHTDGTEARNAFMKRTDTKYCSTLFETTWQARNGKKRGRPRKINPQTESG